MLKKTFCDIPQLYKHTCSPSAVETKIGPNCFCDELCHDLLKYIKE